MRNVELIKPPDKPITTIFVQFTRSGKTLDKFLKCFRELIVDKPSTELLFYIDIRRTDPISKEIYAKLSKEFTKDTGWNGITVVFTENPPPGEVNLTARRIRIIDALEDAKRYIGDSFYLFRLEDDTLFRPDTLVKFAKHLTGNRAFVTGVQVGRHGWKILPLWRYDNVEDPRFAKSARFFGNYPVVSYVDGAGFYCCLTKTALFKKANFRFEASHLGPDVLYVLDLRRLGYTAVVDWTVINPHVTPSITLYPSQRTPIAELKKESGEWKVTKDPKQYAKLRRR